MNNGGLQLQLSLHQIEWLIETIEAVERADNDTLTQLRHEYSPFEYHALKHKLKINAATIREWKSNNSREPA